MKQYGWDAAKNEKLKKERGITFEDILMAIGEGGLLDVLEHPNKRKFGGQKLFIVQVFDYIYLVPFVETEEKIFLKTIIPSRKYTKKYRRNYEK